MTAALKLPQRQGWTVDDLGELPRDLHYELINSRLLVPALTSAHTDLCGQVLLALEVTCPPEYLPVAGRAVRVDHRNEPRPDVAVIRARRAGGGPVPVEDVLLAVAVVAPDATFRDMNDRALLYAHAGVPTYWVIDPLSERITLTEFVLTENGEYEYGTHTDGEFGTDVPYPVTIDLPGLTAHRRTGGER